MIRRGGGKVPAGDAATGGVRDRGGGADDMEDAQSRPDGAAPGELDEELGDGLVLRSATAADADALATFNGEIHADPQTGKPDPGIVAWTRDLVTRPHPTFRPELFTVVAERSTGRIVSSLNLIPQTWTYGGVPFGVGRVELVGTHPDYRKRGLVGRQMAAVHRWSAALGDLAQGITGIPWYYRRFGYEMALSLDGFRRLPLDGVEALAEGTAEPFAVRPATVEDLPFIAEVDAHGRRRSVVACERDAATWRYELDGRSAANLARRVLGVIERTGEVDDRGERRVGYTAHVPQLWGKSVVLSAFELAPGVAWTAVTPSVLRHLKTVGQALAAGAGSEEPATERPVLDAVMLLLEGDHPAYGVVGDRARTDRSPYAWYVRIPDLAAFVRRIAPVLEARLAASAAVGHGGDLTLWFYGSGLRLAFEAGRLAAVEPWQDPAYSAGGAFPGLTFLQLLLGHRSLTELEYAFPDCRIRAEPARLLLESLFPKQPSQIWPVS
jgi:Acetyltransferase (GNAT) domain